MILLLLDITFSSMVTDAITVITSIFNFITSNWLLVGSIGVSIVIAIIFAVYSRLHR